MPKKIPTTILFTVVIAIFGLFTATAVTAQDECSANSVDMSPTTEYPFPMVLTEDTTIAGNPVICRVVDPDDPGPDLPGWLPDRIVIL